MLAYRLLALLECLSNTKKLLMAACYLIDSPFHVVSSFLFPLFVLLSVSFVHTQAKLVIHVLKRFCTSLKERSWKEEDDRGRRGEELEGRRRWGRRGSHTND